MSDTIESLRAQLRAAEGERDQTKRVLPLACDWRAQDAAIARAKAAEEAKERAERERDEAKAERHRILAASVQVQKDDAAALTAAEGALREAREENTTLKEAARHVVELGYDRATQGARWCRFCGRNPVNGHLRKLEGDLRPCPLGLLEKLLYEPPAVTGTTSDKPTTPPPETP